MEQTDKHLILDKRYLRMASIWAENSYCTRRRVGALLVKDQMIISDGFNGTPAGFENICEDENGITKPYVLHAEANAITKVARSNNSSAGSTLRSMQISGGMKGGLLPGMLEIANGHFFRGIWKMIKG